MQVDAHVAIVGDANGSALCGALHADTETLVIDRDPANIRKVKDLLCQNSGIFKDGSMKPQLDGRSNVDAGQMVRMGTWAHASIFPLAPPANMFPLDAVKRYQSREIGGDTVRLPRPQVRGIGAPAPHQYGVPNDEHGGLPDNSGPRPRSTWSE